MRIRLRILDEYYCDLDDIRRIRHAAGHGIACHVCENIFIKSKEPTVCPHQYAILPVLLRRRPLFLPACQLPGQAEQQR
jgi:hypothetical protein